MRRAAVLVCLAALTSPAAAKVWPSPAAGPSASGDPEVVFTFDDGPNPTLTPKVLDILEQHHIQAVFFMVGEQAAKPNKLVRPIVQRMLRDGHVIANHTMKHADLCRVPEGEAIAEIDGGKAAIERVVGMPLVWFRAPYGARCDRLEAELAARATHHFHWDLDPQEWRGGGKAKIVRYVTTKLAHMHGRNVLLMHDMKRVTIAALPEILTWLDEENARRAKSGARPIRVIPAPEIAVEQLPRGTVAFADDVVDRLRGLRMDLARVLPSGLR
jgi:peptidoglycan/xylan/chitin deacetylase (PgdA/CDA1 family)